MYSIFCDKSLFNFIFYKKGPLLNILRNNNSGTVKIEKNWMVCLWIIELPTYPKNFVYKMVISI